jgi:ABC-type polysaccharide/polyol phosphate export permease
MADNETIPFKVEALSKVVIKPSRGWLTFRLNELWQYRELLYFLTWRDIKVRYKQTVLGAAWAIMQPFFLYEGPLRPLFLSDGLGSVRKHTLRHLSSNLSFATLSWSAISVTSNQLSENRDRIVPPTTE